MSNTYWRITYNGIDVYEALKHELLSNSLREEWSKLVESKVFNWLSTPIFISNSSSYLNELGYSTFKDKLYPIIIKYLDEKNINIEKFNYDENSNNILYSDEYQIVVVE